jgi:hypothetical protein
MTTETKKVSGLILLGVPTIVYGGYFLLTVLSGEQDLDLTPFQRAMFRAGHAHAGVLVILSLVIQNYADHAKLSKGYRWLVRLSFPVSSILISLGFFAAALGDSVTKPNGFIFILYLGVFALLSGLITLGVGLVRN